MSGYPGGSGDGNGLDSLFAQLRQQQNKPITLEPSYGYYNNQPGYFGQASPSQQQPQQPYSYQQPSVSSPIPTPPVHSMPPHHASAVMSPAETPQPRIPTASGGASNADRTSSLLNLLKFSQPSAGQSKQPAPIGTPLPPSREPSMTFGQNSGSSQGRDGSDLLAALMGTIQSKATQQASPQFATASQPSQSGFAAPTSPSEDTQAYLLQLLNQPKPSQYETTPQLKPAKILTPPSKASSQDQDDVGELTQALEDASLDFSLMGSAALEGKLDTPLEENKENVREATPKQGLFTYVNPFEQLAASSPRNRTPKNTSSPGPSAAFAVQILKRDASDNKRKADERSTRASPAHSKRKLEPTSQGSSAPPTPLPDGRTQLEALIGIGASGNKETVGHALSEVGDQVDKQVQEALARAEQDEKDQAEIEKDLEDMLTAKTEKEFEEAAERAAQDIQKELRKEENTHALDDLPPQVAEAIKDVIDDAAHGHIADSWESADAEDSPEKEDEENAVKVYNFPMKPWISIIINEPQGPRPTFRDEVVMDIARLKKDFDQVDRTLVTASNNFIVYGMSKNGGVRIIRQDDGKDARLFTETHDRIFSVVTSSSSTDLKESIIGTGISGTVYWALLKDGEGDHIEDDHLEQHGFILPPATTHDSESPGGVLKTRARKSANHPDFFAVGRGKTIHIVWPSVVTKSYLKNKKDRLVDTDKYFTQHSLKVNTGKAGKDFTFSEDDTTIVSLDKAGKVKFWDVRTLTETDSSGNPHPAYTKPIEIKEPIITFNTTPATDKAWPTSVLFVDKSRPYQKGGALRYLIVGMKQNHTLQLWDLALGKPVQEIHLPHGKESDAVCSVLYHANTGMVIIGHPTRNSIYFLHLSAPKYGLPKSLNQAEYMQKLAANDGSIPKPESTAVMSGMREYSFANKGSLRSLDILQTPNSSTIGSDPSNLFELYAMHSKGVTCLAIKQADLGWTEDNKVISSLDAAEAGAITIQSLKEIQATLVPEVGDANLQTTVPTRIVSRPAPKEANAKEPAKKVVEPSASTVTPKSEEKFEKKEPSSVATPTGTEKQGKSKRKKANSTEAIASSSAAPQNIQPSKPIILDPSSHARNGNLSKASINTTPEVAGPSSISHDISDATLKALESRVTGEVKKVFDNSLKHLHEEIKLDRRTQIAVSKSEQDAMLHMVSNTLNDNIGVSLNRIVQESIDQSVIPAISSVSSKAVKEQVASNLRSQLEHSIPKELQKILPDAIGRVLQQPQLLKLMSESLAKSVAFRVEEHFATLLNNVVTPAFSNLVLQAVQRSSTEIRHQAAEQINVLERQRHADSVKIDQLTQLVTGLTETVSSMASAQAEFQGQFLRMQQAASEKRDSHSGGQSSALAAPVEEKTQEQLMFEEISTAMREHNYETAVIRWLQTGLHQELYESYFSKFNPEFVRELNPLLLLSIGSTVSGALDDKLMMTRMVWLETILSVLQVHVTTGDLVSKLRLSYLLSANLLSAARSP